MRTIGFGLLLVLASVTTALATTEQPQLGLKFDLTTLKLEKNTVERAPDLGLITLPPLSTSEYLLARSRGRSTPRSYNRGGQLEFRKPYFKKDGSVISPHLRTRPDNNLFNNLQPPRNSQIDKRLYEGRSPFGP